jgi:hypothetical protein
MWRAEQKAERLLTLRSHWSWFSSLVVVFFQTGCSSTRRKAHHQLGGGGIAKHLQKNLFVVYVLGLFNSATQHTRPQNPRQGQDIQEAGGGNTNHIIFERGLWTARVGWSRKQERHLFWRAFFSFCSISTSRRASDAYQKHGKTCMTAQIRTNHILIHGNYTIKFSSSIEKPVPSRNAPTPAVIKRMIMWIE